ncbi:MAG TPA: aminotransferase class V-fold PLP-dependent enzyme [Firmicutes bacterium]|nr:aminotransferase class V-fold PLP-dependent enzyme [Bacillota bacterium]
MKRVYLDNNATTMVDPHVSSLMNEFETSKYGNPNSLHTFGMEVRRPMEKALDQLYQGIGASEEDNIIVNGCATEGNNTVLKHYFFEEILKKGKKKKIITTSVEHPSVYNTAKYMEKMGADIVFLPVNTDGIVTPEILAEYLNPDETALVSIMWANNETGLLFPVKELAEYCRASGVPFHTDAVQAIGKVSVNMDQIPVDYLTFSAHKFHGPKGVGGLYIRKGHAISPLLHGGEQMGNLRAGTVNVPGFIGMGSAMELAVEYLEQERTKVRSLRDKLEDGIAALPDITIMGKRELRTPNTILASFKGIEGEALAWELNKYGVAVSTGSACASESLETDHTLTAMKIDPSLSHTALRFSLSRFTTEEEIAYTIEVLGKAVERLRQISIDY